MFAKISSDIPLPTPCWVMSSPIHMMNAVPAISVMTMTASVSSSCEALNVPDIALRNVASRPIDSRSAMPSVMYRVICVILRWPVSPSLAHFSTVGITPWRSCMMIDEVM